MKTFNEFMELAIKEFYQNTKDYTRTYNLLKICRTYKYYYFGYFVGKLLENTNDYKHLDELAVCAFYIGNYQESYDLNTKILELCPEEEKARILKNRSYSAKKLK